MLLVSFWKIGQRGTTLPSNVAPSAEKTQDLQVRAVSRRQNDIDRCTIATAHLTRTGAWICALGRITFTERWAGFKSQFESLNSLSDVGIGPYRGGSRRARDDETRRAMKSIDCGQKQTPCTDHAKQLSSISILVRESAFYAPFVKIDIDVEAMSRLLECIVTRR